MPGSGYRLHNIVDVVDGIGYPGVLGLGGITEIHLAVFVHHHVLQQGIPADGMVYIRFTFFTQVCWEEKPISIL